MRRQGPNTRFLGSFPRDFPVIDLPEIAFAGRSNVGKSSALNTLLGSKSLARVSQTPGRTQAINLFRVGDACVFADLPGYGFARVPDEVKNAWKGMIEGYLGEREALRLVVVLVDGRRNPMQSSDIELIEGLMDADIPMLVVATKVDKLKRNERQRNLSAIRRTLGLSAQPIAFSSVTKEGKDAVWDAIEAACRGER